MRKLTDPYLDSSATMSLVYEGQTITRIKSSFFELICKEDYLLSESLSRKGELGGEFSGQLF